MNSLKPLVSSKDISCFNNSATTSFPKPKYLLQVQSGILTRRTGLLSTATLILSTSCVNNNAYAFNLQLVAPDQTIDEAVSGIRGHARALLQVKDLLEMELWRDAQKELRSSSAKLKMDFYTIIQNKPGIERPQLRKLYSVLFNNVTSLDYAARDKDKSRVWECYESIVQSLDDFLSRI
ncbi:hypothetical protein ACFE04_010943 [Oxalis oulophora]